MKRNISVFILLILLASSFKYRTKAKETGQTLQAGFTTSSVLPKEEKKATFDDAVEDLQKANQDFIQGNPEPLKTLWSHSEDITVFNGIEKQELKGWKSVEASLNSAPGKNFKGSEYTFNKIASQQGENQAYLLQEESYKKPGGKTLNLQVTMLFKKENNEWKIVHRHENILTLAEKSDKSSK